MRSSSAMRDGKEVDIESCRCVPVVIETEYWNVEEERWDVDASDSTC